MRLEAAWQRHPERLEGKIAEDDVIFGQLDGRSRESCKKWMDILE